MSLTLNALKKLQEKGQLRAPSQSPSEHAAAAENMPSKLPAETSRPSLQEKPRGEFLADNRAEHGRLEFEPQPTMSMGMLNIGESPEDTASRERWAQALGNPYGPHAPPTAEDPHVDATPAARNPNARSDRGNATIRHTRAADELTSDEGGERSLTAQAPPDAAPVDSLASFATMNIERPQEFAGGQIAAPQPSAELDSDTDRSDIDSSGEISLPTAQTQPAFLSGLDLPATEFESDVADAPLIMDTIHFESDQAEVEPAYNPVIQPLDAFDDEAFDGESFEVETFEVGEIEDAITDDLSHESEHAELDPVERDECSADGMPDPLDTPPARVAGRGSFLDALTPIATSGDSSEQELDEWDAALQRDGRSDRFAERTPRVASTPLEESATGAANQAFPYSHFTDARTNASPFDESSIEDERSVDAQSPSSQLPGTLEERLRREQSKSENPPRNRSHDAEHEQGSAPVDLGSTRPEPFEAGSVAEHVAGEEFSGAAVDAGPRVNVVASQAAVATAYEQTILEELSNSRAERPFLDAIEQIRRLCDYRFPTNLLMASPIPTVRTSDALARIAMILSQVDEELLLVDASDHASLTHGYELEGRLGIADALASDIHPLEIVCATSRPKLGLVPIGVQQLSLAAGDARAAQRAASVLETWERHYHRVLIDVGHVSSPLLPILGPLIGDSVLLIPYGKPNDQALRAATLAMERAGTTPIGCLVTDEPIMHPSP